MAKRKLWKPGLANAFSSARAVVASTLGRVPKKIAFCGSALVAASVGWALEPKQRQAVTLPSGIEVYLQEMLWDRPGEGLAYRFRFVSPEFVDDGAALENIQADLEYLCERFALPRVSNDVGPTPSQIIVSLADRPSEFGVFDENVAQVFEAYRVENNSCVWEAF
ncbi:hypothetical protein ROA7450_02577 [Roseovarius albus]|uniref:Acetolactate synthase n=1 Tax=Roseovarius albus TaxID=1247867 RepID=A0A1X6ZHP0_9RHOB|nr:DUF6497 family protein [Roseovarius albus]SLN51460.1 hypothetical protein ROA7450_02577 [Roseovarius albus]